MEKDLVPIVLTLTLIGIVLNLAPSVLEIVLHLWERVKRGEPLKSFSVLQSGDHLECLVRAHMSMVTYQFERWYTVLANADEDEARDWVLVPSRRRFLDMVMRSKTFFLFEVLPTYQQATGALAYTAILSDRRLGLAADAPFGIALAVRKTAMCDTALVPPSTSLFVALLHEMAHVIDAGDPARANGHDGSFWRAFQYNVNIAIRAGIVDAKFANWDLTADHEATLVQLHEQIYDTWAQDRASDVLGIDLPPLPSPLENGPLYAASAPHWALV